VFVQTLRAHEVVREEEEKRISHGFERILHASLIEGRQAAFLGVDPSKRIRDGFVVLVAIRRGCIVGGGIPVFVVAVVVDLVLDLQTGDGEGQRVGQDIGDGGACGAGDGVAECWQRRSA